VNKVVQHDVNLLAMGLEPGHIALDNINTITFDGQGYTCATGDMHVTERHKLRVKCDMVDMECFSIAKSCLMAGVSCEIYKYISDQADENAATTWKEQVAAGQDLYMKVLQDLQATLEEK
jgi:adenosylhomocysteine nucleosidase